MRCNIPTFTPREFINPFFSSFTPFKINETLDIRNFIDFINLKFNASATTRSEETRTISVNEALNCVAKYKDDYSFRRKLLRYAYKYSLRIIFYP